ncbi:hypothetical protein WKH56_07025 [Priestia sp. SB1]|uniref:hypothetical protein n=1 Tax=Priestia sp. SB1 TaxID=3132359 RepID=UPI003170F3AA
MFKVKKPCNNCPFLKNSPMKLHKDRLPEIVDHLDDNGFFPCHKTIDYNKQMNEETGQVTEDLEKNQFCAGAITYLEKHNCPNTPLQVFQRIGRYDPEDYLKHKEKVIDSLEERSIW